MIYYWENPVGYTPDCGTVEADSDEEALTKMPSSAICLYRENEDTKDGTPFVMVFEKKGKA